MSDNTAIPSWADELSFSAHLFALDGVQKIPVSHLSRFYAPLGSTGALQQGTTDDGWLRLNPAQTAMTLRFHYHSQTLNRLNFMLSLDSDRNRKLGISRNGYLGLYTYSNIDDFWKVEPLAWSENTLHCRIRDHQGQQVKVLASSPHHLTVNKGNILEFLVVRTS